MYVLPKKVLINKEKYMKVEDMSRDQLISKVKSSSVSLNQPNESMVSDCNQQD